MTWSKFYRGRIADIKKEVIADEAPEHFHTAEKRMYGRVQAALILELDAELHSEHGTGYAYAMFSGDGYEVYEHEFGDPGHRNDSSGAYSAAVTRAKASDFEPAVSRASDTTQFDPAAEAAARETEPGGGITEGDNPGDDKTPPA